jgi:penicillin V acylase-like amidase (Ntn superfamily)
VRSSWFVGVVFLALIRPASACTAFFVQDSPGAIVGRNMDWYASQGAIYINKRDIQKTAVLVGTATPLTWKSRYLSLTYSQTGRDFPWSGVNEEGLDVHVLQLLSSVAPAARDPRSAVEQLQWVQYLLDTSSNLDEALANAQKVRVGPTATLHYFLCDASSNCATVEYLNGDLVVHQSSTDLTYAALTNDTFADSSTYLQTQLSQIGETGILTNPSVSSLDRFAKAAIFSQNYGTSAANATAVSYAYAGLRSAAEANTVWSIVDDLKLRVSYLKTQAAPNLKWVTLAKFQAGCSSGTQMLNMNSTLTGEVSAAFQEYTPALNQALVQQSIDFTSAQKAVIGAYPETYTRCMEGAPANSGLPN